MRTYRIGIDVGGTNTDAALLDDELTVLASVKSPTTDDSGEGVDAAIDALIEQTNVPVDQVTAAMLGTTHCTNAIVQRQGLSRVGVIRLGGPATTAVPPFEGWPEDLRAAVSGPVSIVSGGHEFDGREINELDEDAVVSACRAMQGQVDAVAVIGVFAPVTTAHEERTARIVTEQLSVPVSSSSEVGTIGLLERENAAILNAALIKSLGSMATGFEASLASHGIAAEIFFGQNDGTLMSLDFALRYPVLTIGCGPTNSTRGAAHLSRVMDGLVVDIGGTTTDIGVLVSGFPRQSSRAAEIGGIRTNFRMPDVLSIGLGGGSRVHQGQRMAVENPCTNDAAGMAAISIGPDSVGHRIGEVAVAFGGTEITATDIALASGRSQIPGAVVADLDEQLFLAAESVIADSLSEGIDRMKSGAAPVPVVLVGGGSLVAPDHIEGVSEVIRPEHSGAANAVGAALGDIAGQSEKVFSLQEVTRRQAVDITTAEAIDRAVAAGATVDSVEVLSIEELPVSYMDNTIVVRVRAAGSLAAEDRNPSTCDRTSEDLALSRAAVER